MPPPGAVPVYPQPPTIYPQQPPALFPEGAPWSPAPGGVPIFQPTEGLRRWGQARQEVRFEYTWLAGDSQSATDFDVNTLELFATFAVPWLYSTESPLLVTPGFAVHYFDGPTSVGPMPADLPSRVYDAYLDLAWRPRITPWLSGDLGFRGGLYTDFQQFNGDTFRTLGRGLALLTFTPNAQVALGVVYLDRNNVKLLPAGGVIWTPNPDTRFDILFPNPKLARRWMDIGTTEWWWYVAGEYGGGSWAIERASGMRDSIDYNDLRAMIGLEWTGLSGIRGNLEVGFVFDREILYSRNPPGAFKPDDTFMLRAGLAY